MLEICYTATRISPSEIENKMRTGRNFADRELFDEIKIGMERGREEFIKILLTKYDSQLNLVVKVLHSKNSKKIKNAEVTVDGNTSAAADGIATFKMKASDFDPARWTLGSDKSEIEITARATDFSSKTETFPKNELADRYDVNKNRIEVEILLDREKEKANEFEIIITAVDSKSHNNVTDATITFDGETQTASSGTATFKRDYSMLDPDKLDLEIEISAEADKYEPNTVKLLANDLHQKLDTKTHQINLEIELTPKEKPKDVELVILVIDSKSGSRVADASVTFKGQTQTAVQGEAVFTHDRSILDPDQSDQKVDIEAQAKGYSSQSLSLTYGYLAGQYDKNANKIEISIFLDPIEKEEVGSFVVVCDRDTIFEDEVAICVAKIHYKSGKVKDVSVGAQWEPTLVDDHKGTVRGDRVKRAHTLPYTVSLSAKYTFSPEEGGGSATGYEDVVVIPRATAPQPAPAIRLAKTATPQSINVGETVKYTFTATNPGNCELSGITLSDDQCAQINFSGDANGNNLLDPGETWIYECSMTHSQVGDIINTAIVEGTGPSGKRVADTATFMLKVNPELVIVPDIYDLSRDAAEYDIEEARLTVGDVGSEVSDLSPGRVTRQNPLAGTKVPVGEPVHFWLSLAEPRYIYVEPPRATIQVGDTIEFTAVLIFENGDEQDVTIEATWTPGPDNKFIGKEATKVIISAEYAGVSGSATVTVEEPEGPGWEPPITSADDTLANVPLPGPADYTWYALCKKGAGEVVYGEDTDPIRYFIMGGPFPGPRTVEKWINDNCPRWRCTLEGECAHGPARGGDWNVFCNKESGEITIGKGQPGTRQKIMDGGFLGEPDARFWVDQNCPTWRCTKDGTCATEPARGGEWNIF